MSLLVALVVFYAPVLLPSAPARLNRRLGELEYLYGHLRDHTVGVAMVFLAAYDLTRVLFGDGFDASSVAHVFGAVLAAAAYQRHVNVGLAMTELMRMNPTIHPQEYFDRYYDRLGPRAIALPARATRTIDPTDVSFTTGAPPLQSKKPLVRALYDTAMFARSAYRVLATCGPQYGRETFDAMATLWGSRVLQLFGSRLTVEGLDELAKIEGKLVLAFNHKSHLDFVFAFFALSTARLKDGRRLRVRYIAAKDHFVDNALVYSWIGIGKLIEAVDMVFVDRKGAGGKNAIGDASKKLAAFPIDVAIFPQGTRALAHRGDRGERQDAGYYTSQARRDGELSHLKKGAAHLALDTARVIGQPVHVVCFTIEGTATLVPKGSFAVQTETHVRFAHAGTLTIDPQRPPQIEAIQAALNASFTQGLQIDRRLGERFLATVRDELSPEDARRLQDAVARAVRDGDTRLFGDLDFACSVTAIERATVFRAVANRVLGDLRVEAASHRPLASVPTPWSIALSESKSDR